MVVRSTVCSYNTDLKGDTMISTAMSQTEVATFVARLQLNGYKVQHFGSDGWACEINGDQCFRATAQGNERFHVRYNERMFPDV